MDLICYLFETKHKIHIAMRMTKEERARQMAEQLKRNDMQVIDKLFTSAEYNELRQFYKANFGIISKLIEQEGCRTSIENIFNIPNDVPQNILSDEFLFIVQINEAISRGALTEELIP